MAETPGEGRRQDGLQDGLQDGQPEREPDYRYTLANERTFLAWMRTCLALLAVAVAVVQFASDVGSRPFREACAVVLALLATGVAGGALWRWGATQRAMRAERHLHRGWLPLLLALGLALVAAGVVVALVLELLG